MLRSLLTLLAVLITGLAVLFERPWLYAITGLIVIGGLGLLGWWLWTAYTDDDPDRPRPSPDTADADPSLEDFGIVDIKPENAEGEASPAEAQEASRPNPGREEPRASPADAAGSTPNPSSPSRTGTPPTPASDASSTDASPADEAPTLSPLLESLRSALDARTVCLLVQEDVALTYRIEAIASSHPSVQTGGTFDTQTPLLTATMSREAVTLRPLAEEELAIEDLRYYDDPPPVDHLAAAPVSRPNTSSTTFLLADGPAEANLGRSEARTILKHFAETVGLLLSNESSSAPPSDSPSTDASVNGQDAASDAPAASSPDGDASPRPRHEIIAEEMEAAQAAEEDLALALVHLNRAESIARRGEEAVASVERLFHTRLDQLAPSQRIERFGELTYGVFFRAGADAVEPQVADLQNAMDREDGELEGGVSVGVAVWKDHSDTPKALRAAATDALREAYETGTPTIVA